MPHSDYKLYDGGGTSNALQVDTTGATRVASGADLIDCTGYEAVDVWLMNETAGATATLYCAEFSQNSGETPVVGKEIRKQERLIPATDQAGTVDRSVWGLTAGTERAPKNPERFIITPGATVMLGLQAASTGTFYARVALIEGSAAGTVDLTPDDPGAVVPETKALTKVVKAVTTASTAEKLVASTTYAQYVELQAKKVAADNTGNVFVGLSDLDQGTAELFELSPGDSCRIDAPDGSKIDLSTIYIDADTSADGVVGWYLEV